MNSSVLADYLQIWGLEKDFIIFSDGSSGFGLTAQTVDISCWDDEKINTFSKNIKQFLNGLPENIDIQFIQEIDKGNVELIEQHKNLSINKDEIANKLLEERTERLESLDENGAIPRQSLKIFVRVPFSRPLLTKPRFFFQKNNFQDLSEENLKQEISKTSQVKDNLVQSLKLLGIESNTIDGDQILDLIYHQWNPRRNVSKPPYDPEDVRSSLLFTDVSISEKGFSLSDKHYRVLSLKLLPDSTYAAMASRLRELPFGSKLTLSINIPRQHKELEKLKTQRRIAFSMATGKANRVSDIESNSKYQDLETLLEEMIADGEKVFKVALNVVLSADTKEELDLQASETITKLRELGGSEIMEETIASFDIFSDIAIPNAKARDRVKYMKTSNLADFTPFFGNWLGHQIPRMLLRSRMGSLVSFDPFSQSLTNFNQIVSGGSGSGKSFFTNILLFHLLKESPRIFIIDIGGSYRKLCEHLDGQYIPLGLSNNQSLNPFDLNPGQTSPSNEKIKFLLGLVELMTKEDGDTHLPKLERAEIEEAIQKTFLETEPRLGVLREILLNHPNTEIRRYGRILTTWCGKTPYGQFLDAKTNIELQKRIVVFDLKGLESNEDIQAASLFIITDLVWREVLKASGPKIVVFDECWKLLGSQAGLSFIEEVFRTFRKYFASAIAISQNIDDFANSKIAGAILSNSANKWILMQKGADQKRLKEVLNLNENEIELISSLSQEKGHYSEAFLMSGDDRSVVAVESTPLEYWLATTDPRDLALISQIEKSGKSKSEAILEASNNYIPGEYDLKKEGNL
jgi:conjugal transfer ATP-binding protein TraC